MKDDRLGLQRWLAALGRGVYDAILQTTDPAALEISRRGNIGTAFLHRHGGDIAQSANRGFRYRACLSRIASIQADALDVAVNFSAIARSVLHRPSTPLVALSGGRRHHQVTRALERVQPFVEIEIGGDLARRQTHCIVGRESVADKGGDADGDFIERTLTLFGFSGSFMRPAITAMNELIRLGMST